jgi:thiol-disulfide isomerase/thioredoxin
MIRSALILTLVLGSISWLTPSELRADPKISEITAAGLEDVIAQGKGKVQIVDFFATWCPPCRMEIPGFVDLQNKYGSDKLSIIGISVDQGPVNVVENFARELNINYDVYVGGSEIARKYRVRAIPTTYIYDTQGKEVKRHVGFVSQEEFDKEISALLK